MKKRLFFFALTICSLCLSQDARLIPNTWYCTELRMNGVVSTPLYFPLLPNVPLWFDPQGPGTYESAYCPGSVFSGDVFHNSTTSFTINPTGALSGGCPAVAGFDVQNEVELFNYQYTLFWTRRLNNSMTYSIQPSGNFLTLVVTDINGDMAVYGTDATASINEVANSRFTLFPNPGNSLINIAYNTNKLPENLTIYDLSGRVIHTITTGFEALNIHTLSSGTYVLQVGFNDGQRGVQRFVKN